MAQQRRNTIPVEEVIARWHKDPEYVKAYKALAQEFAVIGELIGIRADSGLEQEELAERMNVSESVIIRWEGGWQIPSIETFTRLAEVTGHRFALEFVPN